MIKTVASTVWRKKVKVRQGKYILGIEKQIASADKALEEG